MLWLWKWEEPLTSFHGLLPTSLDTSALIICSEKYFVSLVFIPIKAYKIILTMKFPDLRYFLYKGAYYQQKDGAAMESPVSTVVANIYMEMY